MAKYLFKREGTYYFQKRVLDKETKTYLHIRKSLKTKCYNDAKTLASYLNYKINNYLRVGYIMTKQEIEDITYKYFTNGLEEYEELEDLRHQTNTLTIRGTTYEGSTENAIMKKLHDFKDIDDRRDFEQVKKIVDSEIIPRCGIEPSLLKELTQKKMFYWKMFKYEIELLASDLGRYNDYSAKRRISEQEKLYGNIKINNSNETTEVAKSREIPPFEEILDEMRKYYRTKRNIKEKTIETYMDTFKLVNEIFPDKKINELTLKDCEFMEEIICYIPKNRNKVELTRQLDIFGQVKLLKKVLEQRENDIYDEQYEKIHPIVPDTLNNYFDRIRFFIKYCSEKYQFENPLNMLVMESFRRDKDVSMDRFPISDEEIIRIFNEFDYLNKKLLHSLKNDPLKVFGIFFTMYLGLRPSEVAQLMVNDVKTTTNEKGEIIYYVEVSKENSSDDNRLNNAKDTKTKYAKRKLPLTDVFIEKLHFLEFLEYRKKEKENFIFVTENEKKIKSNIKDTARRCEDRFNDKIKKLDLEDKEKKSYYSLRHSFANKIKHIPETLRDKRGESLMGHTRDNTELFNRYGNKYFEPDFLYEILEQVKYKEMDENINRIGQAIIKVLN